MTGGFYGPRHGGPRLRARIARLVLFSAPLLLAHAAGAQTLTQAWERALSAEPGLQAARAGQRAAIERTHQAFGALLPQLDASFNGQKNWRDSITGDSPGPEIGEHYPTRNSQLNLTQPLWRPLNLATLAQARAAEQQLAFQQVATQQDLHTRFIVAWFDVMGARDNVLQGVEQASAARQQQEVMLRGSALGTHNEVQLTDAQARYQQALADSAAAEAELDAKLALLEQLTGPLPGFVPPTWRASAPGPAFGAPEPLEQWLDRINADNPAVRAAERALAAAREEVNRQLALHSPTLDLVARRARILQGSGNSPGQSGYRSREHSVGLQLNVPLFSGGTTSARVREAEANADKARADLESARRSAVAQARQGWSSAQAAQARLAASGHAVYAAQVALRAATTARGTGLRTMLEELQARQQLAAARRDQERARYDGVVGLVRLLAAAGQPAEGLLPQLELMLGSRQDEAAPRP
ncbi:MAG: type secretion outer membrane protein TolC family [Ramlibacter sp.]|nr:type secretion outer membrane protein TolC family [Ramlibacter sp.]